MIDKVTKFFPCDCAGEGLTVSISKDVELEGCKGGPFFDISFWACNPKFDGDGLSMWERIKYAWRILNGGSLWADMVILEAKVARHLANHILYLLRKNKNEVSKVFEGPIKPRTVLFDQKHQDT